MFYNTLLVASKTNSEMIVHIKLDFTDNVMIKLYRIHDKHMKLFINFQRTKIPQSSDIYTEENKLLLNCQYTSMIDLCMYT